MNMGKDLTEVRSPQRQLAPDRVGLEQGEPTFLRGIANKATTKKRHRFRDLYRCLNEELIYHAWETLNKGAASGVDKVTAEAYAEDLHVNIQRLVERLKTKRYRAKLVRRVYFYFVTSILLFAQRNGIILPCQPALKLAKGCI